MRNRSAGGTSRVGVAAAAALAVAGLVGASAWAVASTRHPASAAATSGSVWVTPAAASDGSVESDPWSWHHPTPAPMSCPEFFGQAYLCLIHAASR